MHSELLEHWFAIRTRQDFAAEEQLATRVTEVFFPKETVRRPGKKPRERAVIPHVLFIRTTEDTALRLEKESRDLPGVNIPFWIYRYPTDNRIQEISESCIKLLRLLTSPDTTGCEIYNKTDFKENEKVRVTAGLYAGYEGYVQRVKKNRHVVVRLEGICCILLPYIHPDLLEPVAEDPDTQKQS